MLVGHCFRLPDSLQTEHAELAVHDAWHQTSCNSIDRVHLIGFAFINCSPYQTRELQMPKN